MSADFNACIAYVNLADTDDAVITASSSLPRTPVQSRLQNPHVARKWRGRLGTSEYIVIDLGSVVALDTVCLFGVSGVSPTFRVRLSTSDTSGAAGDVFDSGTLTGTPYFDSSYGAFIYLRSSASSGRYLRIDISESGVEYIEAGRVFVGDRVQVEVNFSSWSRAFVDQSRRTYGRGGQMFADIEDSYRTLEVSFDALTEDERYAFVEYIDRVHGEHADFLFVMDPTSDNLSRDSIWGFVDGGSAVSEPSISVPPRFSKSYNIRERL